MTSIILIGPPAGGKGTQSELICEKYNIPHISTGDLLRKEINSGSLIGKRIISTIEEGLLVDDKIILSLLEHRIIEQDCKKGYILDGFPRNINQAELYEQLLTTINYDYGVVILINVAEEILKNRILGRLSCQHCEAVYNELIEESKPKVPGICDKCGNTLSKRNDDNLETFTNRINTYHKETEPLINFYKEKNILFEVEGNKDSKTTFEQISNILERVK